MISPIIADNRCVLCAIRQVLNYPNSIVLVHSHNSKNVKNIGKWSYKIREACPSFHYFLVPPSDPSRPLTSSLVTWVPILFATETAMSPMISAG